MALVRQLRAALAEGVGQLPVELLAGVLTSLEDTLAELGPELADSDNHHAHQARDALILVMEEIQAALTAFVSAGEAITEYAGSR